MFGLVNLFGLAKIGMVFKVKPTHPVICDGSYEALVTIGFLVLQHGSIYGIYMYTQMQNGYDIRR